MQRKTIRLEGHFCGICRCNAFPWQGQSFHNQLTISFGNLYTNIIYICLTLGWLLAKLILARARDSKPLGINSHLGGGWRHCPASEVSRKGKMSMIIEQLLNCFRNATLNSTLCHIFCDVGVRILAKNIIVTRTQIWGRVITKMTTLIWFCETILLK